MKSKWFLIFLLLCVMGVTACKPTEPVCNEESIQYVDSVKQLQALEESIKASQNGPKEIEIKGKKILFDQVITGPLCNNHLSGKVYITCDLEIISWTVAPNFLDGCDFLVDPGSEVYVASHNNAIYYRGCNSCHKSSN